MNTLTGAALEEQYKKMLEKLGVQDGILDQIFHGAINKVNNITILYQMLYIFLERIMEWKTISKAIPLYAAFCIS